MAGNTKYSLRLEETISRFLQLDHTVLYPTGWAAGYGVIKGLVRPADHVVMDGLSHACLQEGAYSATPNVHLHGHLNLDSVRRHLKRIRDKDASNGILVVTESLFSMDSDTPDLKALQELCREYGATLLVDVAHDLGAMGPGGRGFIGEQDMLGKVDIVMGSFSKTFGSNGGFVACKSAAVKQYLKFYGCSATFSNALSPVQAATVTKAFEIVQSDQGPAAAHRADGADQSDARCAGDRRPADDGQSLADRSGPRRRRGAGAAGEPHGCRRWGSSPTWSSTRPSPRVTPACGSR